MHEATELILIRLADDGGSMHINKKRVTDYTAQNEMINII
jgi:hypothetical protein